MTITVTVTTTADSDLMLIESMLNGTIDTSGRDPNFFWVTGAAHLVFSGAFGYDGAGNIDVGLIEGISVETAPGGEQIANITTLGSIASAPMLYQAMLNDDESAIRNLIFSNNVFEYFGNDGNDTFTAGDRNDTLRGGAGNDILNGGDGDDTLIGNQGSDILNGGDGNDWVSFDIGAPNSNSVTVNLATQTAISSNGTTADVLSSIEFAQGGTLDDTLIGNAGFNVLRGGAGNDRIEGGAGDDNVEGEDGDDILIGNQGSDYISGGDGNDTVSFDVGAPNSNSVTIDLVAKTATGSAGSVDTLNSIENAVGGALNDTLIGDAAVNVLRGGAGNDILDGGLGLDTLFGDLGNDTFLLGAENDAVSDSGGFDTIISSVSRSLASYVGIEQLVLTGGDVNSSGDQFGNTLKGTSGKNLLDGGSGNDTLDGGAGNDRLLGGSGNDLLNGGTGVDRLEGGVGNDTYVVNSKSDVLVERSGIDVVKSTATHTLKSGFEKLTLVSGNIGGAGNSSANTIIGSTGANKLFGMNGNDLLSGGNGNDRLDGGRGNDTLNGGSGNDILTGGLGRDIMTGNAGFDDFDFNSISESRVGSTRDVINAFQRGIDDIDLRTIDARSGVSGNQGFTFIGTNDFNDVRGELRYRDLGSTCLVQGDVNGDGRPDFEISVKASSLTRGDFLL